MSNIKSKTTSIHEIEIGMTASFKKVIEFKDVKKFSELSGDTNPIHIDKEYAKKTKFKKNVIVGTYLISLAVGMSVRDITINSTAALEYKNIVHHYPAYIGDTVYAVSTIIKKIKKKNNKGILIFNTNLYNQKNIKLISMSRANLFLLK